MVRRPLRPRRPRVGAHAHAPLSGDLLGDPETVHLVGRGPGRVGGRSHRGSRWRRRHQLRCAGSARLRSSPGVRLQLAGVPELAALGRGPAPTDADLWRRGRPHPDRRRSARRRSGSRGPPPTRSVERAPQGAERRWLPCFTTNRRVRSCDAGQEPPIAATPVPRPRAHGWRKYSRFPERGLRPM